MIAVELDLRFGPPGTIPVAARGALRSEGRQAQMLKCERLLTS
jgi:hypothetical protein